MKNMYYINKANKLTNEIKFSISEYNKMVKGFSSEIDRLEESNNYYHKGYIELYDRIEEAIEDLERTLGVNKHYKNNYSEWVYVDIDHIKYLLEILKGEINERTKD